MFYFEVKCQGMSKYVLTNCLGLLARLLSRASAISEVRFEIARGLDSTWIVTGELMTRPVSLESRLAFLDPTLSSSTCTKSSAREYRLLDIDLVVEKRLGLST